MAETGRRADAGFHAGELAVQHRAGVAAQAARLVRMLEPVELDGGIAGFLADRTFAALTGRDDAGRLWVTPLTGSPGFLNVTSPTTLEVGVALPPGDPLHGLPAGQPVGLVVVEFAARRLGPDVFSYQLPERSFGIQEPLHVFAIGANPDQASRAAIERPVMDLFRPRDLELVLQLRVVLRWHASLSSGCLVAPIHGALDLQDG